MSTINQPLIDQHVFRQTQTALSALFMQPGPGGVLNYQTPVLGSPWAIPFEFPLFQWLVASMARILPINLSSCGRLLSIVFGIGCIGPAMGLLHNFGVRKAGRVCFLVLYFSSAIYLYWNRSFMIESAALFFTLLSLYLYSLIRFPASTTCQRQDTLLVMAFGLILTTGLLVKATTALPVLLLIALDFGWQLVASAGRRRASLWPTVLRLFPIAIAVLVALLLLKTWTQHADALKTLNPIGINLKSEALRSWNYGTIGQRFSADLWIEVLFKRMLTPIGAIPAALLMLSALRQNRPAGHQLFMLTCLFLALIPLLIFSNLHIVHAYYQAANQIFLLLAISTAFDSFIQVWVPRWQQLATIALIALFVIANYKEFHENYLVSSTIQSSDSLEIGRLLRQRTKPETVIFVFGADWSSEFAYHSQRRSLTVPPWPSTGVNEQTVLQNPGRFLGGRALSAIVSNHDPVDLKALRQNCPHANVINHKEWRLYLCQG
jgi:hypothetical protein